MEITKEDLKKIEEKLLKQENNGNLNFKQEEERIRQIIINHNKKHGRETILEQDIQEDMDFLDGVKRKLARYAIDCDTAEKKPVKIEVIREHQMETMLTLYDIDLNLKEMYIDELLRRHFSNENINLIDVMKEYNIKRLEKPRNKKAVREIMGV